MGNIELDIRYYHRPQNVGISEGDIYHNTLHRSLRASEIALVLVDVWSDHHIATHLQRGRDITLKHIRPAIEVFRRLGAAVIHAPGPECAEKYARWIRYAKEGDARGVSSPVDDDWPPAEFRNITAAYKRLARPSESGRQAVRDIAKNRRIIEEIAPQDDDEVVANGNQLHRLLRARQIPHLFYAGFAANICVPFKDYGMRAMKDRGYEIVLIRDGTTAIETADTIERMALTKNAIRDTEFNIGYTVSSSELIGAFNRAIQ